jgi:hypothetical protein
MQWPHSEYKEKGKGRWPHSRLNLRLHSRFKFDESFPKLSGHTDKNPIFPEYFGFFSLQKSGQLQDQKVGVIQGDQMRLWKDHQECT